MQLSDKGKLNRTESAARKQTSSRQPQKEGTPLDLVTERQNSEETSWVLQGAHGVDSLAADKLANKQSFSTI